VLVLIKKEDFFLFIHVITTGKQQQQILYQIRSGRESSFSCRWIETVSVWRTSELLGKGDRFLPL